MKIRVGGTAAAMLAAGLAGCATIVHGTTQQVRVETTPAGARASAGSQSIITPGELTLSREYSYIVNLEKPGYAPTYAHIEQTTSTYVWGNLLLGGYMGAAVDYSNGAAYELGPTYVSATLTPGPSAQNPAASDSSPESMPQQQP